MGLRFRALLIASLLSSVCLADNVGTSSFESLARSVEKGEWKSVEDLVCGLPEGMRSHYARVFASRSLQAATLEAPRVISFAADAHLVVAFGGDPRLVGGRTVEVMQFDGKAKRFSFNEIEFPEGRKPIIRRNPSKCLLCHGSPPRPRWDDYFFWPGVLGSEDDSLTFNLLKQPVSPEEIRAEAHFSRNGRYRCLEPLQPGAYDPRHVRPNLELGDALRKIELESLGRELLGSAELRPLRYAMLASFAERCERLQGFFPAALEQRVQSTLEALRRQSHETNVRAIRAKFDRERSLVGHDPVGRALEERSQLPYAYHDAKLAAVRFLVEGFSSEQVIDWSLEVSPRSYTVDYLPWLEVLRPALFETKEDAKLRAMPAFEFTRQCDELRGNHLAAFPDTPENRARVEAALRKLSRLTMPSETEPFTRCLGCHEPKQGRGAPVIPFDDKARLIRELGAGSRLAAAIEARIAADAPAKLRMPPNGALDESERGAIEDFLKKAK